MIEPVGTVATAVCAVACGVLMAAEWRAQPRLRVAAKLVASTAFVVVGLRAFAVAGPPSHWTYARGVFVGLVLGAIGDGCLLGPGKRWFVAGLLAFLLGHAAYLYAMASLDPAPSPGDAGWLALLPIVAGALVAAAFCRRLGALRIPVYLYIGTICAMLQLALEVACGTALPAASRHRLVAGACLFFVSDLAVARQRFATRSLVNQLWGRPTYYAGQLLIAWSLYGL